MKYKGLLLDIDNTLYNYKYTHELAMDKVISYCVSKFPIVKSDLINAYNSARGKVHIELSGTASSHNRLLYFQKMLEILNINPQEYSLIIYNVYWDNFIENMEPFEGVYDLLEKYKNKICLVTDLTAHIQFRKIKKLKLEKYCRSIVTSEEAGREKPHPYMFMFSLQKLNLQANEVCMIGDDFIKDTLGASNLGIKSIWLNHDDKDQIYDKQKIVEVKEFKEILELV